MIPPKRLTDPTFEYTDAANTDIRKRFARVRRELAQQKAAATEPPPPNVRPITTSREKKA